MSDVASHDVHVSFSGEIPRSYVIHFDISDWDALVRTPVDDEKDSRECIQIVRGVIRRRVRLNYMLRVEGDWSERASDVDG